MEGGNNLPYESVHVVNVNTGERFQTYAITGEAGSGVIGLNGAAARLGYPGDKLIIMCSASVDEKELPDFKPHIVFVDESNHIITPTAGDRAWNLDDHNMESEMNEALRKG